MELTAPQQKIVDLLSQGYQPYGSPKVSMNTMNALVRKGIIEQIPSPFRNCPYYKLVNENKQPEA